MKPGDETINDFRGPMGRDPLIGSRVDDYEVQSIVGSGAMGIVYRVQHAVIGKPAALKVLKPDYADDPDMVQRLIREARTVNAIRHPGIVDIFGFGTLPNGQPYIVMDLLEGEPLDAWIKREAPAPFKKVAPILDEMLSALHAAHQVGVIHRDLKPGNVFYENHPDARSRVRIIDFGLARQADRAGGSVRPTNPGTLIGTPAFMAPEQVLGTKVFPATDLYAVGGIAYQMLTGRIPHEAPTAIEVISQKMKFDPVAPKQWAPGLDEDVDSFVMMLLDREPERRPESADDARRMLRRLMEGRTRSDDRLKAVGRAADLPTAIVASAALPHTQPVPPVPNKTPRPSTGSQPHHPTPAPAVPNKTPRPGTNAQPAHQPQASNPGRKSSASIQNPGVVPKRQWGDAKTVLVDPVVNVPSPPSISDSTVSSTDPMKAPLQGNQTLLQPSGDETMLRPAGNETLLAEPTASDAPSPFRDTVPLPSEVNRTQPVPPVEVPAVQVAAAIEESGSTRSTAEHDVAPRSKLPFVVIGVLVLIIIGGLVALLMSQ
ncbi:MAG: protein kinase [Myxococcaceae bacterium]|nr:protein kinase [Myxococcaceae bacterium]